MPLSWVLKIRVEPRSGPSGLSSAVHADAASAAAAIYVREEIVRPDGGELLVTFEARFDGRDFPVEGPPVEDSMAYTCLDSYTVFGTGTGNGGVSLRETATISA